MNCVYSYTKITIAMLVILLIIGCSGGAENPVVPQDDPRPPVEEPRTSVVEEDSDHGRMLWGIWNIDINPEDMSVKAVPLRNIEVHFDITDFVLPPNCDDCLSFAVNGFNTTTRIMDVDVTLRNPTPLTGHDVRGIIYTTDYGHDLTNSDGRTSLWDIPGGDTINPFKAFAKGVANRAFMPDAEHVENYLLYIPKPPHFEAIAFAIDTFWPGNCKEPYGIENFMQLGPMYDLTGYEVDLQVDVHDWQDDVAEVTLQAAQITGEALTHFTQGMGDTWEVTIANNAYPPVGDYRLKLTASSFDAGISLYEYVTITIDPLPAPTVSGIDPDSGIIGQELTDSIVTGSNFYGTYMLVILRMGGEPDIYGTNVSIVDDTHLTCDFSIPIEAKCGMYGVVLKNIKNQFGSMDDAFEVVGITPVLSGIAPDHANAGADLDDVTITGSDFYGPGLQVNLKRTGEPDVLATDVDVVSTTTITCDLEIPPLVPLGLWDVEVINGCGLSDIGEGIFEVFKGIPDNPVEITPPYLNFRTEEIFIDGVYAYVAGHVNGLHIFDITNPEDPIWVNRVLMEDTQYIGARTVYVQDGYAYIGTGESFVIVDVDPPESAAIVKTVTDVEQPRGIHVEGGYAYVGDYEYGFKIIDVDPISAAYVVKEVQKGSLFEVAYRDGYAYVCNEGKGMSVIDVDPVGTADEVTVLEPGGGLYSWGIDIAGDYAYLAADEDGLLIVDISTPAAPFIALTVPLSPDDGASDVVVVDGYAYVSMSSSHTKVVDIDPPLSASVVAEVEYTAGFSIDHMGGYIYVGDPWVGIFVINVMSPESPALVNKVLTPGEAWDLDVGDGYCYIANRYGGLQVVDISNPYFPEDRYSFHSTGGAGTISVDYDNGIAYVGLERGSKVDVIDVDPPGAMLSLKGVTTAGEEVHSVVYQDGYVYATMREYTAWMDIIDVDPPGSSFVVKNVDVGEPFCLDVEGDYAYVTFHGTSGLHIVDVNPPGSASVINTVDVDDHAFDVDVVEDIAYVAGGQNGFYIVDISPPGSAYVVDSFPTETQANRVLYHDGYVYLIDPYDYDGELYIYDVDPIQSTYLLTQVDVIGHPYMGGMAIEDNILYLAGREAGLHVIELW